MIAAVRLLGPYLRPYWRSLLVGLLAMLGEIVTAVAAPVPVQQIIDRVVRPLRHEGGPISLGLATLGPLLLLAGLAVIIAVADSMVTYLDLRETARASQRAVTDLRRALFDHLQRLSLSFHQDRDTRAGELLLRLSGDVQALQDLAGSSLSNVITNGGTALLMGAFLFTVDWRPALIVVVTSLPLYRLLRRYHRRLKEVTREARRQEGRISSLVAEIIGAAKLVTAYGRQAEGRRRVHEETETRLDYGLQAAEYQARAVPAVALATSVTTAAVVLVGTILAMRREITVGQLTLVIAYTRGVFGAIRQLSKLSTQTQRTGAAAERIADLFAEAPTVVDPLHPRALPTHRPLEISFENVSFAYAGRSRVLTDINLHVPAGSTMALVGPTGAGKSTLASLILRFYDACSCGGSVRVGGVDVRELAMEELRSNISLVLQETLLYRDTVWNNIAYGRPDASDAEVLAAAESGGVTRFLAELENGLHTVISENGNTLSGGQKQCVAIARAILRDTPIVILDEPTSSLDARTEHLVLEAIGRLIAGRTTIIIAHRFSTIRQADLVAVLDGGRVVECGSPVALAKGGGLFTELSTLQLSVESRRTRMG